MASRPPDTYTIRHAGGGKCGLGTILDLSGVSGSAGLQENIRNIEMLFTALNLRYNILSNIINEKELLSALTAITNPLTPVATSIMNCDSFVFIALISRGDEHKTILPDGEIVLSVLIEQYFNEDKCRLLRGKPKLFLHLKSYTKISVDKKLIDFQPPTTPVIEVTDLDGNLSSTNLHTLSYCIYDFGLSSLRTENKGSLVLHYLPRHFESYGHDYDFVSFWKKFLGEMSILQERAKNPENERHPTICSIMRNRLMCKLFFLPPRVERHEDQDVEVDLSDDLNRQMYLPSQASPGKASPPKSSRLSNIKQFTSCPLIRLNTSIWNSKQRISIHRPFPSKKGDSRQRTFYHSTKRQSHKKKSRSSPKRPSLFEQDSISLRSITDPNSDVTQSQI